MSCCCPVWRALRALRPVAKQADFLWCVCAVLAGQDAVHWGWRQRRCHAADRGCRHRHHGQGGPAGGEQLRLRHRAVQVGSSVGRQNPGPWALASKQVGGCGNACLVPEVRVVWQVYWSCRVGCQPSPCPSRLPCQVPGAAAAGARQPVLLPPGAPDQILLLQKHHLCLCAVLLPGARCSCCAQQHVPWWDSTLGSGCKCMRTAATWPPTANPNTPRPALCPQFYNGFSGQALVDSITAAVFNVVFTSLPILLFSILDRPVKNLRALIRYPKVGSRSGGWHRVAAMPICRGQCAAHAVRGWWRGIR